LARHGESLSNYRNVFIGRSEDPALTDKGHQQAQSLAMSLKDKKISAIFSSSLLRARQTAQATAEKVGLPVISSDDLMEVNLGRLDGHDIGNPVYLSVYQNMVTNWEKGFTHASILNGESLQDVKQRLTRFLEHYVLGKEWDGSVLLFGHAILWMCFIWSFCQNKPASINDGFMSKTHLSVISVDSNNFLLKNYNLSHSEVSDLL
jgi:broad specificity phosphatase PhoE